MVMERVEVQNFVKNFFSLGIPFERYKSQRHSLSGYYLSFKIFFHFEYQYYYDRCFFFQYVCLKKCAKKNIDCMHNHICKKRCYEECIPCPVLVDKTRSCGHVYKNFKCSLNVEEKFCEHLCEKELSCGHKCQGKCSSPCPPCKERVRKKIRSFMFFIQSLFNSGYLSFFFKCINYT